MWVVGGGGAQTSAVANLLNDGWSPSELSYPVFPGRRILGMEIVMPDGEIVKMGSLANGDDPSGGEGIGPDLRGIMRGYIQGCWDVWESVRRWRSRHCRFSRIFRSLREFLRMRAAAESEAGQGSILPCRVW